MLLLLRPQLVMHWLVMHALAKDSPGLPGDVSVTPTMSKQTFCNIKTYNVQRNAAKCWQM